MIQSKAWAIREGLPVYAQTQARTERLTAAVTLARMYMEGDQTVAEISKGMGLTPERVAQIIRKGIKYMRENGWFCQVQQSVLSQQAPARRP